MVPSRDQQPSHLSLTHTIRRTTQDSNQGALYGWTGGLVMLRSRKYWYSTCHPLSVPVYASVPSFSHKLAQPLIISILHPHIARSIFILPHISRCFMQDLHHLHPRPSPLSTSHLHLHHHHCRCRHLQRGCWAIKQSPNSTSCFIIYIYIFTTTTPQSP